MPPETLTPPTVPASPSPAFPADTRTLVMSATEYASGGKKSVRFKVTNDGTSVLHVRFAVEQSSWLSVSPSEMALGPGEKQSVAVQIDIDKAKSLVRGGAAPVMPITVAYQQLFPRQPGVPPSRAESGAIYVRLPLATCPSCDKIVDDDTRDGIPEVCPYCYERLRACPVCGAPNSWLVTRCILDSSHVIRSQPDWATLGGDSAHTGNREQKVLPTVSRRWSYPNVAPARRENITLWSAPVAAYGLVACAGSTQDGETHLYAWDAVTGAPLYEPYPLSDPVYPERGGCALSDGHLYAATVEGACVGLDALRGTRIWETELDSRVYGAVVPVKVGAQSLLLVPAATKTKTGILFVLKADTGEVLHRVALPGPPDSAPAFADGLAYAHDDSGTLTAIEPLTGEIRWQVLCEAGFDSAPVIVGGRVLSATAAGAVLCHDGATGEKLYQITVTKEPFSGTPACDGTLFYLPADDGLHVLSLAAGRAVRRYSLRRPVRSAPVVVGGTLFFGGTDGNVYAVEAGRTLEKVYETGIGSQIVSAPALADGALFFTATNGVLYALNLADASAGRQG